MVIRIHKVFYNINLDNKILGLAKWFSRIFGSHIIYRGGKFGPIGNKFNACNTQNLKCIFLDLKGHWNQKEVYVREIKHLGTTSMGMEYSYQTI